MPTSLVDASIDKGHNAVIDTDYEANAQRLTFIGASDNGSSLTIQANGSLRLSESLLMGRESTLTNRGTLNIGININMNSPGTHVFNFGVITAKDLNVKNNGVLTWRRTAPLWPHTSCWSLDAVMIR